MFLKQPQTRKFTYQPKYYKPQDEIEEEGPRIKFRRYRQSSRPKPRSLIALFFLIIIIIFLLSYWLRIDKSKSKDFKFENLDIEIIK